MNYIKRRHVHSQRLERWLGKDQIERISNNFRYAGGPSSPWYGPPVGLLDLPGAVYVTGDGDFVGNFNRGGFYGAADTARDYIAKLWRQAGKPIYIPEPEFGVGFTSLSDAIARASSGYSQRLNGAIQKTGPTGVVGVASTLWRLGAMPAAGAAGSAAPGGRAPTSATTGAMVYANPASGTLHLTGADMTASVISNSLMLYDRIFDVAKTMNSTATEAVTGTPSRYQSTTASDPDYAGGNFLFIEVGGTALAATAHNWTTCLYTDQAGSTGITLPSVTGNASAIVDRLDQPTNTWMCPLASGDVGIKALTQMQCSALVATGAINFVIGHPIGIMTFPAINQMLGFDWLTGRELTPRIFDNAALALLEMPKPTTTATTYSGMIYATAAA